ncbi:2,4-dienoyl-CoA reductase [(3E)-enoyl-CoA-producing], mitochondrial-like [Dermacentor silvarum]|uniref:2,4-dienoyl-CoA reductase [(3E)-enoyl-CoA-producing], mitochondrial-like n=1 Tax=Dermacentor silvarum TaxID=543639 RepID=UPI0021011883|nr:2,4-dienoyl-CoA reductase [(3E)-enoyl-CoA-producing], mitochondrial-like [Dermacentor silvarum]
MATVAEVTSMLSVVRLVFCLPTAVPFVFSAQGAFSRLDPDGHVCKEAVKGAIERQGEIPAVANLAVYLVSDYSSWLTGEVIRMDGGHLNYNASVFNRLSDVPKDQRKAIEAAIRRANGS